MNEILQNIINGDITRDNDEKYSGGFWDYAGEIILDSNSKYDDDLQLRIYNALWELAETLII